MMKRNEPYQETISYESDNLLMARTKYVEPETRVTLAETAYFLCGSIERETQVTSIFVQDTEIKTDDFTFNADCE